MRRSGITRRIVAVIVLVALAATVVPVSATAGGLASEPPAERVDGEPASSEAVDLSVTTPGTLSVGNETTATVSVTGADTGISAYELTLAVDDATVATLDDIEVHAAGDDGPLVDVTRSADGSQLTVTVALLDATHDPADEIALFDVVVTGDAAGATTLTVDQVSTLADADLEEYAVDEVDAAAIEVTDPSLSTADLTIAGPESLAVGESATATVALEDAPDGVGAYDLTLAVDDPANATLEDELEVLADGDDGPLVDVDRSADGSQLTVSAALLDAAHEPADTIELFDVPITGDAEGTVTLDTVEITDVAGVDAQPYRIEDVSPATIDVESPSGSLPPLPSDPAPEPPAFEVSIDAIDEPVTAGTSIAIETIVRNVGGEAGATSLTLVVDGEQVDAKSVELAAGAVESVRFDVPAPETAGAVDLAVHTPNDETTAMITVESADEPAAGAAGAADDASADESPANPVGGTEPADDSIPGFGVVAVVAGLGVSVLVLARRRSYRLTATDQ